jgi:hypothetical protein
MTSMGRLVGSWTLLVALGGCASSAPPPPREADGSYHFECQGPLAECLLRAEKVCKSHGGYVVASARDVHEMLGHDQGQSQVEVRKSEAVVFCGNSDPSYTRPLVETRQEPVRSLQTEQADAHVDPATARRACVPGATQACIGPAGCKGGQSCAADGSRFEPCNCGVP